MPAGLAQPVRVSATRSTCVEESEVVEPKEFGDPPRLVPLEVLSDELPEELDEEERKELEELEELDETPTPIELESAVGPVDSDASLGGLAVRHASEVVPSRSRTGRGVSCAKSCTITRIAVCTAVRRS